MISLVSENWLLVVVALAIGVLTAFWAWAGSRGDMAADHFDANDGLLEKAGDAVPASPAAAPVVAPDPEPEPTATPAPDAAPQPKPVPVAVKSKPKPKPTPTPKPRVKKAAVAKPAAPPPAGKPNIPQAEGAPDNLRLIKGVGPKLTTLLTNLGVTRFDQIAAWKEAEIAEVDQYLESFAGRITRDSWIDQAKYLAKDDIPGFEKKYGKL